MSYKIFLHSGFPWDVSLDEVSLWVNKEKKTNDGCICPCCNRPYKVYRYKFDSSMAYCLIKFYWHQRTCQDEWVSTKDVKDTNFHRIRKLNKTRHWKLVDKHPEHSWWSVTQRGVDFIQKRIKIPGHYYDDNGSCVGYDLSTSVGISEALGDAFDYDEMMQTGMEDGDFQSA